MSKTILGFLGNDLVDIKNWTKIRKISGVLASSSYAIIREKDNGLWIHCAGVNYEYRITPLTAALNFTYQTIIDSNHNGYIIQEGIVKNLTGKWKILEKYDNISVIGLSAFHRVYMMKITDPSIMTIIEFPGDIKIDSISCGSNHTIALSKIPGRVYSKGVGSRGQLGHGDLESSDEFREVVALGCCVVQVSTGNWHSNAITEAGDVFSWGWNESGQLGVPSFTDDLQLKHIYLSRSQDGQIASGDNSSQNTDELIDHLLTTKSSLHSWPTLVIFPMKYGDVSVCKISSGNRHSACLDESGRLFVWGCNKMGQLGDPNDNQPCDYPICLSDDNRFSFVASIQCFDWATEISTQSE